MSDPIATFEAMLARGQDNEMLRLTLGNACLAKGDVPVAIEHFRRATELKPDYSAAWKMLGRALSEQGAVQEAIAAFDQGLQVADANGDKQAMKEIQVFRKRACKRRDAGPGGLV